MKNAGVALGVGMLFAVGLTMSGMTRPYKVIGFLDLFGNWDPSLIFVMLGAIGVHAAFYPLVRKRKSPLFSTQWHVPTSREITPALVGGSFIFGIGWGLAGYCPGPALASLSSLSVGPFVFIASMLVGMILFRLLDQRLKVRK